METAQKSAASTVKLVPLTVRTRDGKRVAITGDFTGWSAEGIPMQRIGEGRFKAGLRLTPGVHEYRLIVDGEWADDLNSEHRSPNPFGTENSVLHIR